MDLSYAQIKRLYKKKKYRFSVGVCGGFNWACVCRYEVERACSIDDLEFEACLGHSFVKKISKLMSRL